MASKNRKIVEPPENMPPRADACGFTPNREKKSTQAEDRERFWNAFKACTEEHRVASDRSQFYVKWAKEFVDFLPAKRLKARSARDIASFLRSLAQRQGITDWQVRQAEHALKILYEDFLPAYSPQKPTPVRTGGPPDERSGAKAAFFRDRAIPGEVERKFPALVERFRTELRTRHYSYRTETAYLDWMRRFIAFHVYANPETLIPAVAVREYLEYLAVKREVSASTQNQALNALVFFYGQILHKEIGEIDEFARAKRPQRLPEVLTRGEVEELLSKMEGVTGLMAV